MSLFAILRAVLPSRRTRRRCPPAVTRRPAIEFLEDRTCPSGVWTTLAPLPEPHSGAGGGVIDGKLYLVGAVPTGFSTSINIYDPATDTWSTGAADPLNQASPASGVIGGKLYVAGGAINGDGNNVTTALEVYDPLADTWTTGASMPTPRYRTASGVIDGKLYVAGGQGPGPTVALNRLDVYDPATNTWTTLTSMPTARTGFDAAAGVIDGRLYVVGGNTAPGSVVGTLEVYNPITDSWSTKASMPTARASAGVAVLNGSLYVAGGLDAAETSLATVESYDPATDTWAAQPSLLTPRNGPFAAGLNNVLYVGTGNSNGANLTSLEALVAADITPPETSISLTGTAGSNGWYVGAVLVALSATDPDDTASTLTTSYAIDGGTLQTYAGPFSVTGDGVHHVTYFSQDPAGNIEAAHSVTIMIDSTAPALTAAASQTILWPPNGKMVAVTVTGAMSDSLSGINLAAASFSTIDEYGRVQPSGTIAVNADGTFSFSVDLEARRDGRDGDGRTYTIVITALDLAGNLATATIAILVPHDLAGL
jgi:N-acetylneuraminic acid mutarotase